ncbi:MAG: SLC13 family permease [Thermodesulfobacteriota bacterium]
MMRFGGRWWLSVVFVCWAILYGVAVPTGRAASVGLTPAVPGAEGELFEVYGKVVNAHGVGVEEVEIEVRAGTIQLAPEKGGNNNDGPPRTEADGSFQARFLLPPGAAANGAVEDITVTAVKTSYARETLTIPVAAVVKTADGYLARANLAIKRAAGPAFWVATGVFLLAYVLISFELLHRTLAAMLGASIMLVVSYTAGTINPDYHILSYESAIAAIDMNVIFLLMGMMIIVGILKHTGIFQWCAYKSYQLARGNVMVLAVVLMLFTGVTSAFLDNVTTMLLLTPVSIEIALSLGISPIALLIPEILASNIGGTATLIGDPPNIMIGSYAGLTFTDFVVNLAPTCAVGLVALFVYSRLVYGREYGRARVDDVPRFLAQLREEYRITDATLLGVGLIIMAIVIGLFLSHGYWHMEVSIAALFGAALLFTYSLLTRRVDLLELIEKDIEWTTLLFFMFLFMLVGGVEETGLLDIIADEVLRLSGGNLTVSICLILWVAAIMSAFVDNIPFTATMLPIVAYLTEVIPGADSNVLWWALAFGACFGGNGTMIGASANVVTLGIAESAGHPIRFISYMKVGFPCMLLSVALANVWLLLFY